MKKSLEEFLKRNPDALPAPGKQFAVQASLAGTLVSADVPPSEAEKFASEALAVITGKEFIHDLSEAIGTPQPGETKEQFVERCEAAARNLMTKKLP